MNKDDFDFANSCSSNYMSGNGSDIYKRINAMLDNTLELNNLASINTEQAKHSLQPMPHVLTGPHSHQTSSYHDNQYNNISPVYPGFQMFYQNAAQQYNNQPYSQYKPEQHYQSGSMQYKHDLYQQHYKPDTYVQQSKDAYFHQKGSDMFTNQYSKPMVDTNSTQYKIESMMALAKAAATETPQKTSRAIRGSPGTSDFSDYDSSTGTPGTPSTPGMNDTLSPIEQIFGLMSGNRQKSRNTSPYESDTSGHSSEGSEAALIDMMNVLKLSKREASSPINDLSKQLFTAQQQHHQQSQQKQQQISHHHQQQQQQSFTNNVLKLSKREASSPINDLSKQLFTAQQQQQQHQQASLQQQQQQQQQTHHQQQQQQQQINHHQQQQQQSLIPFQQQIQQQQQQQLMAVTQAANQQRALPAANQLSLQTTNQLALPAADTVTANRAPGSQNLMRAYAIANLDPYAIDRAARLHRSAAGNAMCEASCTWSGKIPPKNYKNPTTFSCKVFLGGVPWDITEAGLQQSFNKFGSFKIEWPGRDGYVYLLFESEKAVRALLQECTHDFSNGEYYYNISSRRMRSKEVQVIPWILSDSNYVGQPSQRLEANKTVFVGALHGMISAETLSVIMDDLFGNVVYAGLDSDKHKYPIGSGRVTFSSRRSYMKAVQAAFVEIKTPKFTKKIQIDPYLEDCICSMCNLQQGSYFCRDLQCFKYFCRTCWYWKHEPDHMRNHKPLSRNTKGQATLGLM